MLRLMMQAEVLDALPDYGELRQRAAAVEARPDLQLELLPGELEHFKATLRHFQHSAAVKDQALGLYVNAKVRGEMRYWKAAVICCILLFLLRRCQHSRVSEDQTQAFLEGHGEH